MPKKLKKPKMFSLETHKGAGIFKKLLFYHLVIIFHKIIRKIIII